MQTLNNNKQNRGNVEKYLMKDIDPLIKSIMEARKINEEAVCQILEYNEGYISQLRSRENATGKPQVSGKFLNQLKSLQNATPVNDSREKREPLEEALSIIKQQNEWLRHLIEVNLAALSTDLNNNTAAIRAELRGYAHRQILKEVNYDDAEFLKAKAEADKIYLLNLKTLLKGNNTDVDI